MKSTQLKSDVSEMHTNSSNRGEVEAVCRRAEAVIASLEKIQAEAKQLGIKL